MVFSSAWLAAAARVPAELCQGPPPPGQRQRLRADEVLRALFLPTVQGIGRLADCLFIFFCLPLPEYNVVPVSGRGGWVARPPGAVLYSDRRSLSLSSSSSSSSWTSELPRPPAAVLLYSYRMSPPLSSSSSSSSGTSELPPPPAAVRYSYRRSPSLSSLSSSSSWASSSDSDD